MNNLVIGTLIVISCLIGFIYSWKEAFIGNYKLAVILLLIFGLILRVYVSCDFYLHDWDEQFHALVAKNIMLHPFKPTLYENPVLSYDFRNWNSNHVWVHKQPLPLGTMAISMFIFGVNEIALRLPSILLSTLAIWLTFEIGSFLFNKRAGYIAALLFAISGVIIEVTGGRIATDHVDLFFMFFILLGIYFSTLFVSKPSIVLSIIIGVCIGAAILCKWLPALIVIPVWLLFALENKEIKFIAIFINLLIISLSCAIVFMPWQIFIHNVYPEESAWESSLNLRHFTEVLDGQSGAWYYFINKIRINYGELIYLPLAWFVWIIFKRPLNLKYTALLIWIIIPLLFFSFAKTKMQGYILFIAPALFIVTGAFWDMLKEYANGHKLKWMGNLILILLIALPIRYAIERVKPFSQESRAPQWVSKLKLLNDRNFNKAVLFNYDKPISAMFYTGLTAYEQLPDKSTVTNLINQGYTVLINSTNKLTQEIKDIKGIRIVDLGETNYPK